MQAGVVGSEVRAGAAGSSRAQTLAAAFAAALLGGFLVCAVGFSPIAALHNAAHDTRHSMVFPCH